MIFGRNDFMTPLEALERIKNAGTIYVGCASNIYTRYSFECKEIEKSLKALEIIKEKYVDIYFFKESLKFPEYAQLMEYNTRSTEIIELTQEEFDLLKEVLR